MSRSLILVAGFLLLGQGRLLLSDLLHDPQQAGHVQLVDTTRQNTGTGTFSAASQHTRQNTASAASSPPGRIPFQQPAAHQAEYRLSSHPHTRQNTASVALQTGREILSQGQVLVVLQRVRPRTCNNYCYILEACSMRPTRRMAYNQAYRPNWYSRPAYSR